jgi:hypothetical protein
MLTIEVVHGLVVAQRPCVKELLKHKFIKNAKKIETLTDLLERTAAYRAGGVGKKAHDDDDDDDDDAPQWDFGTVKK